MNLTFVARCFWRSDLAFVQVGVGLLATQMHVSDPDMHPVRLVHLLLYEIAQFLDEFGKMSCRTQTQLRFVASTRVRLHVYWLGL